MTTEDRAAKQREYYTRNREKIQAKNKAYYEKNKAWLLSKQKEKYQREKDRSRGWSYGRLYGITLEEFEEKAKAQDHLCAICGVQPDRLHVDHDHESGTIRDLLCRSCNLALGHMQDDSVRMYKAAEYLDRHNP